MLSLYNFQMKETYKKCYYRFCVLNSVILGAITLLDLIDCEEWELQSRKAVETSYEITSNCDGFDLVETIVQFLRKHKVYRV